MAPPREGGEVSWKGYGARIRASFYQLKAQRPAERLDNGWLGAAVAAAEDPPRAEPYSAGTVSHWLTERYEPGLATWEGLARVFGHLLENGAPDPGLLAFGLPLRAAGPASASQLPALPPPLPLEEPPGTRPTPARGAAAVGKRKRPR